LLFATRLPAQLNFDYTEGKFMIKGQVIDVQTKSPVPMANILFVNRAKGATCDNEGRFTLYVSLTDTLKFTSTGYMAKTINVSDLAKANYYTLQIQLIQDFIKLKEITIYPYRNMDEFKQAFIDARNTTKLNLPGLEPKYNHKGANPKFYNPISYLYNKIKKRGAADPDFKP
jgi:CarboxypepD_reg-like domain